MLDGFSSSRKKPGFPANVWVEVWVEKGVVWVDKIYVDGIFICLSLTHKFVPFRQQRRGKSRVAVILSSLWWNPSIKVVASPLWDECGSLLDGRVLWWMCVLVSMEKELESGP